MTHSIRFTLLALVSIFALCGTTVLRADDKDDIAKKGLTQFIDAMKSEDIEAVMKTVDVPWFHDGKKVIREKDELKQVLEKVFANEDASNVKFEIKKVTTFGAEKDKLGEKDRELLAEVARDDDRIFVLAIENNGESEKIAFLVRVGDKGAKVIGVRD